MTEATSTSRPGRFDTVYRAVGRVEKFRNGHQVGSATAFHYQGESGTGYIVTNRHVATLNNPDLLVVSSLIREVDHRFVSFAYPLLAGGRPTWREIPDGPDLIAIPLENSDPELSVRIQKEAGDPQSDGEDTSGSVQNFMPWMVGDANYPLRQGDSLMIVGFPLGLFDRVNHAPVARGGILASIWGADFNGNGGFLVDATCHPGMSGSPVVSLPKALYQDRQDPATGRLKSEEVGLTRTTLVGIHFGEYLEPRSITAQEFYDYQDVSPNHTPQRRGMMLSFAAYAHFLKDLAP